MPRDAVLRHPPPVRELIAESPFVAIALAATLGLLADRYLAVPPVLDLLLLLAGFAGAVAFLKRSPRASIASMWLIVGALAALYHHAHRNIYRDDDIGHFCSPEPKLVRLRGVLDEEPTLTRRPRDEALVSYLRPDPSRSTLAVQQILLESGWASASGRARLTVAGPMEGLHVGDEVEVFGWLDAPRGPMNPGEFDYREHLRDNRVRAEVRVQRSAATVVRLQEGWHGSLRGWLAQLRGWGQRAIQRELPREQAPLAEALLLGDGSAMTTSDWDRYIRTGVIHVLAISGQHLAVLGFVFGAVLRMAGVRRRSTALMVAGFLLGYALLTGFRPPVQRAVVMATIGCAGVLTRRLPLPANTFALAWCAIILFNPTEPFSMGCQLSFLFVAVLAWGVGRFLDETDREATEIDRLVDQSRSPAARIIRGGFGHLGRMYLVTLVVGMAVLPIVAARQHVVSLSGLVIGPPVIVLSSIALIAGFLMLLVSPIGLAWPFAVITRVSLGACDWLVGHAERLPGSHFSVAGIPEWWLWVFYLGLLALLWWRPCWPRRRWFALGGVAWVVVGLAWPVLRLPANELRVTFLAVGHGGCTVIEMPDGRVLMYDAGAMGGPELTRRYIAPFLWSRGHRRVDELFLSHADLDHFNGVAELLERFEVGLVTMTPSFQEKHVPGVRRTLTAIRDHDIAIRFVSAGARLSAGEIDIEVLHPPKQGPEGEENVRSLVLRVSHYGHAILLTGDLQTPGLEMVTRGSGEAIDVLMAPHHGSPASNTPGLADWARPRLVVACDAVARPPRDSDPYTGIDMWVTGVEGAVTIRSHATGLIGETFATGRRRVIRSGPVEERETRRVTRNP